jgi:hypothetical protein
MPLLTAVAFLVGVVLGGNVTWRLKKAHDTVATVLDGETRFVDMGVKLVVVRQDPKGEELIPGLPRMRIVDTHVRGGIVDRAKRPAGFCAPTEDPAVWYCGEVAEELVLHADHLAPRLLVDGAMGAGKTRVLAQWLGLRAIEFTGTPNIEIGATAPTAERTGMIARAIRECWPAAWWKWRDAEKTFTLANDVVLRLVSTHQNSEAEGSRVQGYNWAASGSDEIQDCLEFDGDIEARGRAAPGGVYRRLATATVKESPSWRTWKGHVKSARHPDTDRPLWSWHRMQGVSSPFVAPDFWQQLKATLTEREYQRKVLALDVGPERMVYTSFDRKENLRPIPQLGAMDVTREVLGPYLANADVLVGHDPGKRWNVSLVLKAFRLRGRPGHSWWVVDELTTQETSSEQHGIQLRQLLRTKWGLYQTDVRGRTMAGTGVALVRIDPKPFGERNDDGIERTVTTTWHNLGIEVRPATYSPARAKGGAIGGGGPGQVPREHGIEMVKRLF